ncbi:MAG: hypothetical protein ACK444_02030, partial [Flavobacteriales bacterium]
SLLMRLVKTVPHSHFLVQVHEYNEKYLIKITLDHFEQTFKIPVGLVVRLESIEDHLNDEFYRSCFQRFLSMREDYNNLLNAIKHE